MIKSFQKWMHKKGVLGAIAKNAMDQYSKWKRKDEAISESDISANIFRMRYTNPNGVFDDNEKIKIAIYLSSGFLPDNLTEFCLVSLDIEGNINPLDGKTHSELATWLEEYLVDFGYPKIVATHLDNVFRRLNFHSTIVNDFNVKWFDKIRKAKN